jgi:hypothetical protein
MSVLVEHKFATLSSSIIPRFKVISNTPFKANGRCNVCMDSEKNNRKARFYILERNGRYWCYCQNCSYSQPFSKWLKQYDPALYSNYLLETFEHQPKPDKKPTLVNPVKSQNDVLKGLVKISTLSYNHPAKKYVMSRQIPVDKHYKLFYTPYFSKWVNPLVENVLPVTDKIDPRLVLPLLDREGNCFGVQARDLTGKSSLRYITFRFNENFPKVYGLEDFNPNYKTYLVEGPIDSLFLPNALAMAGADVPLDELVRVANLDKAKTVKVYDNEKHNKQIVQRMQKAIDDSQSVCIWPSNFKYKDINEAILGGVAKEQIKNIIDDNTYHGLRADLELKSWQKC